jgi:hypothetical protein
LYLWKVKDKNSNKSSSIVSLFHVGRTYFGISSDAARCVARTDDPCFKRRIDML